MYDPAGCCEASRPFCTGAENAGSYPADFVPRKKLRIVVAPAPILCQ